MARGAASLRAPQLPSPSRGKISKLYTPRSATAVLHMVTAAGKVMTGVHRVSATAAARSAGRTGGALPGASS